MVNTGVGDSPNAPPPPSGLCDLWLGLTTELDLLVRNKYLKSLEGLVVTHNYCIDRLVKGKGSRRCLMVKRAVGYTSRWENLGKCLDLAKREIRR